MADRAIQITLTNETQGYQFSSWVERLADTYMGEDATMGEIYRAALGEYGRPTSKVFVDTDAGPKVVGWFFVKRARYEDTNEQYLQGAWITVGEYEPARPEAVRY